MELGSSPVSSGTICSPCCQAGSPRRWHPRAECEWWLSRWVSMSPRQQSQDCGAQAHKCPLSEGEGQGGSQEVRLEEEEAVQGSVGPGSLPASQEDTSSRSWNRVLQQLPQLPRAPETRTQFGLASFFSNGSKGSSLGTWGSASAATLEVEPPEPWFPGWGKQRSGWLLPVAGPYKVLKPSVPILGGKSPPTQRQEEGSLKGGQVPPSSATLCTSVGPSPLSGPNSAQELRVDVLEGQRITETHLGTHSFIMSDTRG